MPTTVHGSNLVGAFSQLSVAAVKSASFRGGNSWMDLPGWWGARSYEELDEWVQL